MLLFNIELIFSVFPVNCNLQDEYTFQLICNLLDICLVTLETKASTLSLWRKLLFSHSVVSKSLQPHGMQHARLPCPSLSPGVCSTHVHWASDAIQPSHPLSPPFPPAFTLVQYQGLFQGVGSSHQVAKELELQLQHQSFQWIFRTDFL